MDGLCFSVVASRKEHPVDKKDLLDLMLNGKDPKTGQGLSEDNIARNVCILPIVHHLPYSSPHAQLMTFLIAGNISLFKSAATVDKACLVFKDTKLHPVL